jgi:hypothetical protein
MPLQSPVLCRGVYAVRHVAGNVGRADGADDDITQPPHCHQIAVLALQASMGKMVQTR